MQFLKMHGIGNDFMLLDSRSRPSPALRQDEVRRLAASHTGVGFDQLVEILPGDGDVAAEVQFRNADGSTAGACGNGLRCAAAHLLWEQNATSIKLRTVSGVSTCKLQEDNGWIEVEMGYPRLDWQEIPLSEERDTLEFPAPQSLSAAVDTVSAVSMGNPHCVIFADDLKTDGPPVGQLARLGTAAQRDPLFPDGVNLSIADIKDPGWIRLYVWERGAGMTKACGSAACAAVVAAARRGLAERIAGVEFRHGALRVSWPDYDAPMRLAGPVAMVYRGTLDPSFLNGGGHAG